MYVGNDSEPDEDIPEYWDTFDTHEKDWSINEEKNSRNLLGGMKMLTDS